MQWLNRAMLRLLIVNILDKENKMRICKLSDIAKFTTGKLNSNAATKKGRYPFFTCAPEPLKIDTYAYDTKAIILAGNNAEGNFHIQYYEGKFNAYQRTYIIETNDETIVDLRYLYYALKICLQHFKQISQGTATKFLTAKILNAFELPIPRIEEQQKIALVLAGIDEKIKTNEMINNNLEQQAKILFKSWFVDFEPFNGTMPSDWEIVPLEKIADFQNGYAFKSKELLNEPSPDCYQVFKQGHIARGGGFIPDGTKSWYPKSLASKLKKFVLKKGDILMAMTDMKDNVAILGNTAIMPLDNEYIVNQRVGHLRANGYKGVTYPFIYLLTNSTDFLVDLRSRANSGVQVNLSSSEIKTSQTVLPSEKVNTAFSEITLPMFETIISNQLENQRLVQLRDTLLPKLMSGELDVSDIDL